MPNFVSLYQSEHFVDRVHGLQHHHIIRRVNFSSLLTLSSCIYSPTDKQVLRPLLSDGLFVGPLKRYIIKFNF